MGYLKSALKGGKASLHDNDDTDAAPSNSMMMMPQMQQPSAIDPQVAAGLKAHRKDPSSGGGGEGKKSSGGGFQAMGLDRPLLGAILHTMKYNVPTPIQRKAIPLMMQGVDVVAMARTGSGKTAAYAIPMLQRLGNEHSTIVGIRGLVLAPTRELAIQITRQFQLLGKQTNLKLGVITGGMSVDKQFATLATNPDIVVCTPGRFLHVMEETSLQLLKLQALVIDEADRLFELGFQPQVISIMRRVPDQCQRSLFSATMPSVLAEFTKAGLHNPIMVRLDTEAKLSEKLSMATFVCRTDEKVGALMYILNKLIKVPTAVSFMPRATVRAALQQNHLARRNRAAGPVIANRTTVELGGRLEIRNSNKNQRRQQQKGDGRKRAAEAEAEDDNEEAQDDDDDEYADYERHPVIEGPQVLIFVESKHHVECLGTLLVEAYGIATAAIHGGLDQEARKLAITRFTRRQASVMVVTDVAARGLDIPLLDYVVNYSFPYAPKLFIHRVGRVARAGRSGSAFSILTADEMPYFVDVMHFLDRPVVTAATLPEHSGTLPESGEHGCIGRIPDQELQAFVESSRRALTENGDLKALVKVMDRSHSKYSRTKKKASVDALREAHDDAQLRFEALPLHPLLATEEIKSTHDALQQLRSFKAKETFLDMVHGERVFDFKRKESIQEIAKKESAAAAAAGGPNKPLSLAEAMMQKAKQRREKTDAAATASAAAASAASAFDDATPLSAQRGGAARSRQHFGGAADNDGDDANDFGKPSARDSDFFMPDRRKETADNMHYSVKDATLDLGGETAEENKNLRNVFTWSKKKNRFIKTNINEAKTQLLGIKNEAGKMIDFKKSKLDLYAKWTKSANMRIQDCGEQEDLTAVALAAEAARVKKGELEDKAGGSAIEGDEETVDISDPNQGKKLRIGRKLKKMVGKNGKVRNFDDIFAEKQKKNKEKAKIAARQARKRAAKKK